MIKYKYKVKTGILYLTYSGKVNEQDLFKLYEKLHNDDSLQENLRIFQDENNARFVESEKLIELSNDLIKKLKGKYTNIKIAVWQNDPVKTAYSYFFKQLFTDQNTRDFLHKKSSPRLVKKII